MNTVCRAVGRLRAPVLTLLVGMGFVVQAPATPLVVRTAGVDFLSAAGIVGDRAIQPAPDGSTLLPLRDQLLEKRGPRRRISGGSGRDLGPDGAALRDCSPPPAASWRARATGATTGSAACVSARDALARAGRLSAPSTAPPTSPF